MPRFVVLLILLALVAGVFVFLSTVPKEQQTKTVEVDVPTGNAH
jgi:hypothetical protein